MTENGKNCVLRSGADRPGPGRAAFLTVAAPGRLLSRAAPRSDGGPFILTLDRKPQEVARAPGPSPQRRGRRRDKGAAQPPPSRPRREEARRPTAEAGPPSGPRARGPGATREGAQAGRRQKRSAPNGRGKRQEPPGPDPPRRGPQRAARQGRRPQGPGPPQRDPPGEPRGRADGRRRPADRPSAPRSRGQRRKPTTSAKARARPAPGGGGPSRGPAGRRPRGPGRERSPRRRQGRRAEPAAGRRSRGGPRPSIPIEVPPISREAGHGAGRRAPCPGLQKRPGR